MSHPHARIGVARQLHLAELSSRRGDRHSPRGNGGLAAHALPRRDGSLQAQGRSVRAAADGAGWPLTEIGWVKMRRALNKPFMWRPNPGAVCPTVCTALTCTSAAGGSGAAPPGESSRKLPPA